MMFVTISINQTVAVWPWGEKLLLEAATFLTSYNSSDISSWGLLLACMTNPLVYRKQHPEPAR
jgi:hypothetical protein